jgi:mono/diheme cytochrome c family protein
LIRTNEPGRCVHMTIRRNRVLLVIAALGALLPGLSLAQQQVAVVAPPAPDGDARLPPGEATYGQACAECHGTGAEGGRAPSLLGPDFLHGGDAESLANSIRRGYPPNMPAFEAALSVAQINSVVDFLQAKGERCTRTCACS